MAIGWGGDEHEDVANRRPVLVWPVRDSGASHRRLFADRAWAGFVADWALIVAGALLFLYCFLGAAGWL